MSEPATPLNVSVSRDSVESDSGDADDEEPTVPWTASFSWEQTYNAAGLTRGGEPTYNPEYSWGFSLAVGYKFGERTSITLTQPWSVELTDSDLTNSPQEWWILDTSLGLSHSLPTFDLSPAHTLKTSGSLRLILPTSKQSQARTVVLGTRFAVSAKYTYEHLLKGFVAGLRFGYLHRFTRANTLETETSFPCFRVGSDISENCSHLGGSSVTANLLELGLSAGLAVTEQLSFGLDFSLGWNRGLGFDPVSLTIDTGDITVPDRSVSHWRNTREIELTVAYAVTRWFSATFGIGNLSSELGPDGTPRGLFHAVDTQLSLGLSISFDELYLDTQPEAESTP